MTPYGLARLGSFALKLCAREPGCECRRHRAFRERVTARKVRFRLERFMAERHLASFADWIKEQR